MVLLAPPADVGSIAAWSPRRNRGVTLRTLPETGPGSLGLYAAIWLASGVSRTDSRQSATRRRCSRDKALLFPTRTNGGTRSAHFGVVRCAAFQPHRRQDPCIAGRMHSPSSSAASANPSGCLAAFRPNTSGSYSLLRTLQRTPEQVVVESEALGAEHAAVNTPASILLLPEREDQARGSPDEWAQLPPVTLRLVLEARRGIFSRSPLLGV